MLLSYHLRSRGEVDCLSEAFAIEVDWADKWAEAIGQSMYYAAETGKKPAIILLCRSSSQRDVGLCTTYVYRMNAAFRFLSEPIQVWWCSVDSDMSLEACTVPVFDRE